MSASGEFQDHLYFVRLEELFIALRGAPLLLSPADWQIARKWHRAGIPLDVAGRVIEEVIGRDADKKGRTGIRSLAYFDPAVTERWREIGTLSGPSKAGDSTPTIDLERRLRALAAAVPERFPRAGDLRARIRSLRGSAEEIETSLTALDRELTTAAEGALTDEQRRQLAARVDRAAGRFETHLDPVAAATIRRQLESRVLREISGLPHLSLFAPQAKEDPPEDQGQPNAD